MRMLANFEEAYIFIVYLINRVSRDKQSLYAKLAKYVAASFIGW